MGKIYRAAVLLLFVVVPLCMYTGALFIGIQLGRALERRPDGASFSVREVVDFVAKELWDTDVFRGRGRGRGERSSSAMQSRHPNNGWGVATPVAQRYNRNPDYSSQQRQLLLQQEQQRLLTLQREQMRQKMEGRYPGANQLSDGVSRRGSRDGRSSDALQSRWGSPFPLETRNDTSPRGVVSVGPWGGSGGQPFRMRGGKSAPPRLHSITVYHSPGAIHSLACEYSLAGDDGVSWRFAAGPWGRPTSFYNSGLRRVDVELSAGEHVTALEGTTGRFANVPGAVVTSLTFRTSRGRTYGPFGGGGSSAGRGATEFSVPVADGACITGFWGRSGWLLDAVGVYVSPCRYPAYRSTRSSQRQGSGGESTYYRSSAYYSTTS